MVTIIIIWYFFALTFQLFIFSLISHCSEFKFIRRPRSSLPDGFKMDKLSGSCYFLERRILETNDENVLWQKLASPRKRRDTSPSKSPHSHRNDTDLSSTTVPTTKSNTLEIKDIVTSNGNCTFNEDMNDTLHKDMNDDRLHKNSNHDSLRTDTNDVKLNDHTQNEEEYCIQSFKETSV